jgi:hypothetical protein
LLCTILYAWGTASHYLGGFCLGRRGTATVGGGTVHRRRPAELAKDEFWFRFEKLEHPVDPVADAIVSRLCIPARHDCTQHDIQQL